MNLEPLPTGSSVHFYRDITMPGKRGPYPATVLNSCIATQSHEKVVVVTIHVTGPSGGWTEIAIPLVDDVAGHDERCCVLP